MESDELRFRHVGLSSEGAMIFCDMDNGKTYAMPLGALERAEDWNPKAKPESAEIIHDGYAVVVEFDTGLKIDFPSDFVLHICEPTYSRHKDKGRGKSGVGKRIRDIRKSRGLTLDALAAKCGIAKPNLSRLEHDKVTPTIETLRMIAAGLRVDQPVMFFAEQPIYAWEMTQHRFGEWSRSLNPARFSAGPPRGETVQASQCELVSAIDLVSVFLAKWPEHRYARARLLNGADPGKLLASPPRLSEKLLTVVSARWAREQTEAKAALNRAKRGNDRRVLLPS